MTGTDSAAVQEIIAVGRFAAGHGWVPATSGNFSRRLDGERALVSRSGADKGAMQPADVVEIALREPLPRGVSAETPLHVARYLADASIGAIVHVHSVAATVLSRLDAARGFVTLEGFEMQKALDGFTTHESTVELPVFANAQDTAQLAEQIERSLMKRPPAPGYLLAGHGLYAWGATMDAARRHAEGFDFLLRCALEERRIGI
jgi:methylthioribulose-1-phosphate dehydratase